MLALLAPLPAVGQAVSQHSEPGPAAKSSGPLPTLSGIPITFECTGELPPNHPVLGRYPGQDAHSLAEAGGLSGAAEYIDQSVCGSLWRVLEDAGAHRAPTDVRLPARGVLQASLKRMWIEGSRVVEQRIGSTIMPMSIPHWAVAMSWEVTFTVEYSGSLEGRSDEGRLLFEMAGAAEQDDYAQLNLDSLLRGAALETFADLPRVLADDGHLGDLLFAVVPSPEQAPEELELAGEAAEGFWQLLSTRSEQRHDAMAFYLASDALTVARRVELARWFLINDPDVSLRRDALGWLLHQENSDPDADFSAPMMELLSWLVLRERSSRVRAEAVRVLGTRPGEQTRLLLVAASTDADKRVADRAMTGLRKEPPPTAADLAMVPAEPAMPAMASWTWALDGRVAPKVPSAQSLVGLALAVGGPAAETWLARWAVGGELGRGDEEWAFDAWSRMVREAPLRVKVHTLERLASLAGQSAVAQLIEERIDKEKHPTVRVAAISAVRRFDRPGLDSLLIEASRAAETEVRIAAVDALTRVPGLKVDERLERLSSDDPDNKVRRRARRVLRTRAKEAWDQG